MALLIDLSGEWSCRLDPQDTGITDRWYQQHLGGQPVTLPGSLQSQGLGETPSVATRWVGQVADKSWYTDPRYAKYREPGNFKVPCWLLAARYYTGPAWYQRTVEIPADWTGQRVVLRLERAHWKTEVWWDGHSLGYRDSLSVPHCYEVGVDVAPGTHVLTLWVDNRVQPDVGCNSHSVSDHTQTNWNGVIGALELRAEPRQWIEHVEIIPDFSRRVFRCAVELGNRSSATVTGTLSLFSRKHPVELPTGVTRSNYEIPFPDGLARWDEFAPHLDAVPVELHAGASRDQRTLRTGWRELGAVGTSFTVNGRTIFLRGTVECCVFPRTGYPPVDEAAWVRIFDTCRSYGLNHVRFHSWCPPEAAFAVADRLGVYLQIECPSWACFSVSLGDNKPLDRWLYEEGERIVRCYGHHPSFLLMAYGNEPSGREHVSYLKQWVRHWKARDPRRFHTSGAGWPRLDENDYHNVPDPRIQLWQAGITSRINARPAETITDYGELVRTSTRPLVAHETGEWCVYPDFSEIEHYTGVLRATNFEIFRDTLAERGMEHQAKAFLSASGRLQIICYKEEVESALRTRGLAGFQLLQANDFPGQGTALVGWLNAFWESKGYTSPAEFKQFCAPTVLLARMAKRCWRNDETLAVELQVAHYGPARLESATVSWSLGDRLGRELHRGTCSPTTLEIGADNFPGTIRCELRDLPRATALRLCVRIEALDLANDWDLWVYPEKLPDPELREVVTAARLSDEVIQHLHDGATVLWLPAPDDITSPVVTGMSSIFWNTAWTEGQAPHTLGILCDPTHPLFEDFPTNSHSNWQWQELLLAARPLILDALPHDFFPVVQLIDTWFENRKLGVVLEARVGRGRLLACTLNLTSAPERLVARQFLHALKTYAASADFTPQHGLTRVQLESLIEAHAGGGR